MTILTEGQDSFFLTAPAILFDEDREVASSWASPYINNNKHIKWVLGKYVEADSANSNGQFWTYDDLQVSQFTINHSPMNMDHHRDEIVGAWTASEMMFPTDNGPATNPWIETLGAFWKWYFPNELKEVQRAYDKGQLWVSMESISESITCGGDRGCGETYAYAGPNSDSYCAHIQERSAYRQLNKPEFLGGALIIGTRGTRPGWKAADVKELSKLTTDETKDKILADIAKTSPELDSQEREALMWRIQMQYLQSKVTQK
jgi:hypothetical protein